MTKLTIEQVCTEARVAVDFIFEASLTGHGLYLKMTDYEWAALVEAMRPHVEARFGACSSPAEDGSEFDYLRTVCLDNHDTAIHYAAVRGGVEPEDLGIRLGRAAARLFKEQYPDVMSAYTDAPEALRAVGIVTIRQYPTDILDEAWECL